MIFRQVNELPQNIFLLRFQTCHINNIQFSKTVTITFKNVCRLAYETPSSVLKCIVIQCMYITAVCVRSLIKLRWLKTKFIRYCYCNIESAVTHHHGGQSRGDGGQKVEVVVA